MFKIIEMSKIRSGKNIRNEKDDDILELAQSIETLGLINPITVKPVENGFYEVVTDLDAATFKRQAELEKLQYYQTLNKVYGEVIYQEGRYYEKDPCDK